MREIEALLGTPYRFGGKGSGGTDCSGFVVYIYRKVFGMELPHNTLKMFQMGEPVIVGQLRLGDLVFFRDVTAPGVSHVGIYLDGGQFAHASNSKGVIISDLKEKYYALRFTGARRIVQIR